MQIKVISRLEQDSQKLYRNPNPELHPFEKQREYTRAMNSVKVGRMLAKPFLHALSCSDGVYTIGKSYSNLNQIYAGTCEGDIYHWDLTTLSSRMTIHAHQGFVRGICSVDSSSFISCGQDKTIKFWKHSTAEPSQIYLSKTPLTYMDHHASQALFATSSSEISIWNHERNTPIYNMNWGAETISCVRFNRTETNVLASCGTDRSVILYDLRTQSPLSKMVMAMSTNVIAWNPMEAFNFTIANEDHNCYTFDMRNLSNALCIHKDHVSAVLDIDYSPTGQEFVTGSFDKTIRIFGSRQGRSREVYFTKRMQKIFCVKFSMDAKFLLSGSDDGNVRLWKANAADKLGTLSNRERNAIEYSNALKERYQHLPDIRRIDRSRHVPQAIKSATNKKKIMIESRKVKDERRRKHSKPGSIPYVAERKKHILTVQK